MIPSVGAYNVQVPGGTSPVRIRRSGQAFMVIGSRIATNYGL